MQIDTSSKLCPLIHQEEQDHILVVKRKTDTEEGKYIFGKKQDLRKSLNFLRKLKKGNNYNRRKTTSFNNPYIRMKMEVSDQDRNAKKLVLACINVGSFSQNPETAPSTLKREVRSSCNAQKNRNTSLSKSLKKCKMENSLKNSLIKRSKQYIQDSFAQTNYLMPKSKSIHRQHNYTNQKMTLRTKKSFAAPQSLNTSHKSSQNSTIWPFNAYKTIQYREARNTNILRSQQIRQMQPVIFEF